MKKLEFWFDYGSTYTYLTVARLGKLSKEFGFEVDWKPFFLTALFTEMGLPEGPFVPYPSKLNYMWNDLQRRATKYGLPYEKPKDYPFNSLLHVRIGFLAANEGWCQPFTEILFQKHWTENISMVDEQNIRSALTFVGQNADLVFAKATQTENKDRLKLQTAKAKELGIFGSPTFIVGNEMFWGDDRLEDAIHFL